MAIRQTRKADRKLAQLMLYVALKCEGDPAFGAVKLNKILFLADFLAYARFGSSITDSEYVRLEHGPAPRRLVPVRTAMVDCGEAALRDNWLPYVLRPQQRLIALKEPDLTGFSAYEIALTDSVIDTVTNLNGHDLSDITHNCVGWVAAEPGDVIPYESALISDNAITADDRARTRQMVHELNW